MIIKLFLHFCLHLHSTRIYLFLGKLNKYDSFTCFFSLCCLNYDIKMFILVAVLPDNIYAAVPRKLKITKVRGTSNASLVDRRHISETASLVTSYVTERSSSMLTIDDVLDVRAQIVLE